MTLTKRQASTDIKGFRDSVLNMCEPHENKKQKHETNEKTSDAALKLVAVELNKRLPAKENEQDPIPSDDEDGYPDLKLDPLKVAQRKQAKLLEKEKKNSS